MVTLVSGAHVYVMSHFNGIFLVHERDDTISRLDRSVPRREQIFQDRDHALAKLCGEPLENEVGVGLADGAS